MAEEQKPENAAQLREKIAAWPKDQQVIGERLHEIVMATVPELRPKLYYGQPGYARTGPALVFFRNDDGLISFGLTEKASFSTTAPLVESAWFVNGLDADAEQRIAAAVQRAAG